MKRRPGFSLLELLVAMGLFGIVLTVAYDSIGSIYFSQKRVSISQDFHDETRFLVEKIAHLVRENTIDYDRYFFYVGPDTTDCASFDDDQRPVLSDTGHVCHAANAGTCTNNVSNRFALGSIRNMSSGYENIFYWDTNDDDEPDKNLGGKDLADVDDDCVQAFYTDEVDWDFQNGSTPTYPSLMLINSDRTMRTAVRLLKYTQDGDPEVFGRLELQTQLLADTDDDGVADLAGPLDINEDGDYTDTYEASVAWNTTPDPDQCEITFEGGTAYPILGDHTEENCNLAHDWTTISFEKLNIEDITFTPEPQIDPYLAFRRDDVQQHPNVWLSLNAELKDFVDFGYDTDTKPQVDIQTSISSRIYGDIRD